MSASKFQREPRPGRTLLSKSEQVCAAVLVAVSLAIIAVVWLRQHSQEGGVLEIDRAGPLTAQFQVDINKADWPELTLLPGIGETLAQRIVESRQTDGPFLDHNDLERVRGIGPKTIEQVRPYLLPLPPAETIVGR